MRFNAWRKHRIVQSPHRSKPSVVRCRSASCLAPSPRTRCASTHRVSARTSTVRHPCLTG